MKKIFLIAISLLLVIVCFAFIDYRIHDLKIEWGVPDYYYKDKIIYGFLWGIVGLFLARKLRNIWLQSLVFSGVIAITLQTRYFLEGYDLSFVILFLLFHFLILYFLSLIMFVVLQKNKILN